MKNRIKKYLIVLFLAMTLCGCKVKTSSIKMEIQENTLSNTGATIIITDETSEDHTYGEWFRLDRKDNNSWVEQEPIIDNYFFNMIGYVPDKNNQVILEINWENLYGPLAPGEYRIVKKIEENQEISTEFTIE